MKTFSITEALTFGWNKTRVHSGLLFQIMLTFFAQQVASEIVDRVLHDTLMGFLASAALFAFGMVLSAGFAVILLKLARGHAAHYRDLFPPAKVVWPFFAVSMLTALATVAGLILLIVPGLFVMVRLSMSRFEVIDRGGITESLKRSWHETKGHTWHLFGFFLVLVGINIVGAIALLVGLLVSIPVSALAYVHVYEKLKHHA